MEIFRGGWERRANRTLFADAKLRFFLKSSKNLIEKIYRRPRHRVGTRFFASAQPHDATPPRSPTYPREYITMVFTISPQLQLSASGVRHTRLCTDAPLARSRGRATTRRNVKISSNTLCMSNVPKARPYMGAGALAQRFDWQGYFSPHALIPEGRAGKDNRPGSRGVRAVGD